MLGRRGLLKFVAGPPFVVLAVFFIVPLVLIAAFSFREGSGVLGPSDPWAPTTEHYAEVLTTPAFMRLLGLSVLTAAIIAGLATVLAYPVAYFLTFRAGRRAPLYLILLLIPFAVSYLLRVMAWKLMLGPEGGINSLLAGHRADRRAAVSCSSTAGRRSSSPSSTSGSRSRPCRSTPPCSGSSATSSKRPLTWGRGHGRASGGSRSH